MLAKDEGLPGWLEGLRQLQSMGCILKNVLCALGKNVCCAVWSGRVLHIQTSWFMVLLKCPTSYLLCSLVALFITASVMLKSPVIIAESSVSLINLSDFVPCILYLLVDLICISLMATGIEYHFHILSIFFKLPESNMNYFCKLKKIIL